MLRHVQSSILRRTMRPIASLARYASFNANDQPRIRLGVTAPNFKAVTTSGEIDFHEFIGDKWTILFSHPADFTPVCTTELGAFSALKDEFAARNAQLIGLSADSIQNHDEWVKDIEEVSQLGKKFDFPIIGDVDRNVSFLYDMVDEEGFKNLNGGLVATIRNVYIIDPNKKVRLFLVYPASVGRNTAEVLRALDALQLGDKESIATPVNWSPGEDVILPVSVSTEAGEKKFGKVTTVKPYLRFVNPNNKKSSFAFSGKWGMLAVLGLGSGVLLTSDQDNEALAGLANVVDKLYKEKPVTDED